MTLTIGDTAPDFTLKNTHGDWIPFSSYRGKPVVVLFFPMAFSSVCTTELCTVRDNLDRYNSLDAEVVGISVDSFYSLKEFKARQSLNFTLLSDFNKEAGTAFGVLYEEFFGYNGVAKRSAFVVDADGVICHAEVLEEAGNLPDFKAIEAVLQGLG
jgi:peroxiredoxin